MGYFARIASGAEFNALVWKNVELYLLGCAGGVAIVEDRYKKELNPNVAMEWGWMRAMGKPVLCLIEEQFRAMRADIEGFVSHPFKWDKPEEGIPGAVKDWIDNEPQDRLWPQRQQHYWMKDSSAMPQLPYCFVLMPFGIKSDPTGTTINFDRVYADLIEPAIRTAGLDPIRADNEMVGGIIHKPMFERLVLCEYAVADLTMANANVYYELGVRHAVRPWSTVLLYAGATRMPFDVALLRALPYKLSNDGLPSEVEADRATLIKWLLEAREAKAKAGSATDSPLFQLLEGFPDAIPDGPDRPRQDRHLSRAGRLFRDDQGPTRRGPRACQG